MKEEQANEIDKAFREGLGNTSATPPPKIWNGLRTGLIEKRLVVVENQNYWLKLGSGLLSVAVVVLLSLLYKSNATNLAEMSKTEKTIFRDRILHDTVYVSKIEKVYVPTKEYVYLTKNQATFDKSLDENTVLNSKKINQPNLTNNNQVGVNIPPTNIETSQSAIPFSQPNDLSKQATVKNANETKVSMDILDFKGFDSLNAFFTLPNINFQSRAVYRKVEKKDNRLSFKNPSVKLFYAPEIAQLPMKTDGSLLGEAIRQEKHHKAYSYGANLNFELNDRLSLESGVGVSYSEFHSNAETIKGPVIAEIYNGEPSFIYRTALGAAVIPTDILNIKPANGNSLFVENEEKYVITQLRVPLLLKYKFYEGNRIFGVYTNRYGFYQVLGAELSIKRSQSLSAEIYEADGRDFHTTFTDFKEIKSKNFGLVFGTGFEYNLSRKLNFYVEPTIRFSAASYSQSSIVKSYPRWWSFAFGFQYGLK